jgi:methenyltetrahydromethanopterin cyclohydrolase
VGDTKMISYSEAISSIDNSFLYSCEDETYEGINWQDDRDIPSKAVLDTEIIRLKAEDVAQEYARNRKIEYNALNQFELISDDTNNGTTTHIDAVNAIKTKYPKP